MVVAHALAGEDRHNTGIIAMRQKQQCDNATQTVCTMYTVHGALQSVFQRRRVNA